MIAASYVTGSVSGTGKVGGTIIASYSTASVTSDGAVGGLAKSNFGGRILTSYSTGSVTGTGVVGGLVGGNFGNTGTATDSYWDTQTSGQSESAGGEGKTTSELQSPTGYTEIYESWNLDLDGVGWSWRRPLGLRHGKPVSSAQTPRTQSRRTTPVATGLSPT